jgi:hypothetical protein
MQDQDNITQKEKENGEIQETQGENAELPGVRQTAPENVETSSVENTADGQIHAQSFQETPPVEFSDNQELREIPTVELNSQAVPPENNEFQTVQSLEVQDVPKADVIEEPFMFNGYEIKTWEFNPRIYKILTGSTIFCVLALVAVGQSNVLNTRACESPLVSKVCQVLDTVYVGSVLLGTDSEWVSEPYEKTELGDAEITYIDTSNVSPPLPYPQGYFALANPEMMYNDPMIIPGSEFPAADGFPPSGFPPSMPPPSMPNPTIPTSPNPITKPAVLPTPNRRNLKNRTLPESGMVIGGENPIGENAPKGDDKGGKKEPETADKNKKPEDKQPDIKSDSVADVKLNREPLYDLGDYIKELKKEGKVDLNTPFFVQANGKLEEGGKIKKINFTKAESTDQDMVDVVQRSIAAINDSGYLQYLKELSGKDLNLIFSQNNESIVGEVQSELESERRANSIKSSLNLIIGVIKATKTGADASQNDKDDLALLEGATVETDGKKIIIKFNVKKEIAHPMIERKLLAPRNPEDKPKSNSAAQAENNNSKAGK